MSSTKKSTKKAEIGTLEVIIGIIIILVILFFVVKALVGAMTIS